METNIFLSYENKVLGIETNQKLPCLIVTGFLGSGKTTLLNQIVKNKSNLRTAILSNELNELNIDSHLIKAVEINSAFGLHPEVCDLSKGCLCCTVSSELRKSVLSVLDRKDMIDYLVIETSGAADPRPACRSLLDLVRIDQVVTVVDGSNLDNLLNNPIFNKQLSTADLIILNKADLVQTENQNRDEELKRLIKIVSKKSNKSERNIICTSFCNVPLPLIMDVSISESAAVSDGVLSHEAVRKDKSVRVGGSSHWHNKRSHEGFDSHSDKHEQTKDYDSLGFSSTKPFYLQKFQNFILRYLSHHQQIQSNDQIEENLEEEFGMSELYRSKAIVYLENEIQKKYIFQFSGRQQIEIELGPSFISQPTNNFVLISNSFNNPSNFNILLQDCTVPAEEVTQEDLKRKEKIIKWIESQNKLRHFKIDPSTTSLSSSLLDIRFGMIGSQKDGIYENEVNLQLIKVLNGGPHKLNQHVHVHGEDCHYHHDDGQKNEQEEMVRLFVIPVNPPEESYLTAIQFCSRVYMKSSSKNNYYLTGDQICRALSSATHQLYEKLFGHIIKCNCGR